MDTGSHDEDRLFDEAVDLMIRLRSDPGNAVTAETIRRWRQRGPDYERAWAEAAEIGGMAGQVLAGPQQAPALSRRKLLIGAPLLAGAALGGSYLAGALGPRADFSSTTAELREIALADGSRATLGPDSAIALDRTEGRRGVSLLRGMAYFDVAEDGGRPFAVRAGPLTAASGGGAFDVSDNAGFVTVSVTTGSVRATGPWHHAGSGLRLEAGQWINFDGDAAIETGMRDLAQVAAWRDGIVVAEREPVAAVVARVARWRRGQVLIMSRWLGAQRVSGVFNIDDPLLALQAVVHPYDGKVREISSLLTVVSLV